MLRHAFRAEIGAIGKHAGQHSSDVLRHIARPDMGELVGKTGPFMYFPQEIGHLDQRIHFRDFGIEGFRSRRYIAGKRCHDQRAILHLHTIELPETGAPCQLFEVGIHHLPDIGEPGRAVSLNAEPELILLLQGDKSRLRHQMFVDRPERPAAFNPDIPRTQPVAQMGERGNFVKPPIGLSILKNQLLLVGAEMSDRDTIRQNTTPFYIKRFQRCDRSKQRIVPAARMERECLKESTSKLSDIPMLLCRQHQRRSVSSSTIASRPGLI